MQFPQSWLREFCDPKLTTKELADKLTMAGLEVEELTPVAPPFTGVVVGEIKECAQHPDADRLRVCQVDVGTGTLLNIVCGAPNARVGIKIPCATVGAALPPSEEGGKPFAIKLGKLRGVESQGMLCSAKELKISEEASGLFELPVDAPVGQDIRTYLNLDDTLLTLKLTPNLAHCLSVYGVAREVSAITGAALCEPVFKPVSAALQEKLAVNIAAPDLCGRFSGRIVRGVNFNAKTPQWMVDKLARCGQRSVNALVDISNYVMFELGRPTHIFDLDKIKAGLTVRWGRAGEQLKLLNGNTVTVDEQVGVIADETAIESLAGIMGGDATAVSESTKNIYIEAAFWYPSAIAGRSRRFNFSTDAGHRFERGVDPELTVEHIERITQLVLDICGTADTQVGVMDDQRVNMPVIKPVTLRVSRAAKVSGMALSKAMCLQALSGLGLHVVAGASDDELVITPPSYRFDITLEEDLIEEVVRTIGFDQLPTTKPLAKISPKVQKEETRSRHQIREALASLGYQETINFSFVPDQWERELAGNHDPIKLMNPIASQMNVMRSSLLGSLIQVAKYNQDRKAVDVRVFELGRVFSKDATVKDSDSSVEGVMQPMRVAALASGSVSPQDWQGKSAARAVDFFDAKADLMNLISANMRAHLVFKAANGVEAAAYPALHPGRSARVYLNCSQRGLVEMGVVGELHPKWTQTYGLSISPVLFELDLDVVQAAPLLKLQAVPKAPWVQRDLAVVVAESVTHAQLMDAVFAAKIDGLLQGAVLFDVYRATNQDANQDASHKVKSLAVRLTLGDLESTLTEVQIEGAVAAVLASLTTQVGAKLR